MNQGALTTPAMIRPAPIRIGSTMRCGTFMRLNENVGS